MTAVWLRRGLWALGCAAVLVPRALAVPIDIVYLDGPGEGFFDPELGARRRAAFEFAADKWAATLAGTVPIAVEARMDPLGGSGGNATLASSGAVTVHRNFGRGLPNTWYGAALASQLLGADINGPDLAEVEVTFNSDIDGPQALGSVRWYYGLDGAPGVDIDFVTLALHELGHGFGFFESVDGTTGAWRLRNDPGIFDRMLFRPGVGRLAEMRAAERLAAVISGNLLWDGPNVVAFNGSGVPVYAPEPFQPGASIGHWDAALTPDEVIEPFYTSAVHDLGLLLPAMMDMGWQLLVATPSPRASPATPTPTFRPRFTPTPGSVAAKEFIYVTNFDDGTVSVIDAGTRRVVTTIPVDDGPMGVAAAPDGGRVFVANFHAGTVSVVDTRANKVAATIPAGESPNSVAVTPDGAFAVVTDTAGGRLSIVDAKSLAAAEVDAGPQAAGLALDAEGKLAFVTNFSGGTVTVVDVDARLRRAIIPVDQEGLVAVAIASEADRGLVRGLVAAVYSSNVTHIDAAALRAFRPPLHLFFDYQPEAVVMRRDGTVAYVVSHDSTSGAGELVALATATNEPIRRIGVDNVPTAMALSRDQRFLWVANSGSNTVMLVDVQRYARLATIRVGRAPMGLAIAAVPVATPTPVSLPCAGDCDGDGAVTVDELVAVVNLAVSRQPADSCPAADRDLSGSITVDEVMRAVEHALAGCG